MVVRCKTISGWKTTKIPEEIKFELFQFLDGHWQWNEDKNLLIDPFNVIRRTNKDIFIRNVSKNKGLYLTVSQRIIQISTNQLELFNHWYESTEVY